jgi:hypothetical protein
VNPGIEPRSAASPRARTGLFRAALLFALAFAPGAVVLPQEAPTPAASAAPADRAWSGGLESYLYLPEDDAFLMPILRADRGSMHLEGRYQYEDRETASLWLGFTLEAGKSLHLEATPMAGVVFGRTNGFAPGLELTLSWRSLELYGESEYVFDLEGQEGDYFYNWSELSWQVRPWLALGLSTQRTRLYQTELTIERGLFVAVTRGPVTLKAYGFDLDGEAPFAILALGVDF